MPNCASAPPGVRPIPDRAPVHPPNPQGARYTARMPALPPDSTAAGRTVNPARTLLESPLAAATRGRVYHLRRQPPPRQRGRHVLAMAGTLLVHLFFLFGFVLGAAYQPKLPPPARSEQMLQVRLIEPPEPPPPPAMRGAPPKERGPRHQGRRTPPVAQHEPSANTEVAVVNVPPVPAPPLIAAAAPAPAPVSKPAVTTPPPVTLPAPAPLPLPKPVVPAGAPPVLALPLPTLQLPRPPQLQPEPVRAPQAEGNRPILPPASLAVSTAAVPVPANLPAMALPMDVPEKIAAVGVTPTPPSPAAPDVPRLQPLPLPAQPAPTITLPAPALAPVLVAPATPAQPEVASVVDTAPPAAPARAVSAPTPAPIARLDLDQLARTPAVPPAVLPPTMSSTVTVADATSLAAVPNPARESVAPATPASVELPNSAPELPASALAADISRAPDATPQGSDSATVGEPAGVANEPSTPTPVVPAAPRALEAAGKSTGTQGKSLAAGKPGRAQPGAMEGAPHGAVGDYVQLKPTGDTEIMRHGAPDIGYRPTRFDKDWTPEDESSVDTALRRAVEKTTIKHTFHLPRGVRVECAVKPLLPIALFGCHDPDPPALPVPEKVYAPLHLAPAQPLAPPVSAASSPAPAASSLAPMIKVDNRAECAAARVAGGPLPPGCLVDEGFARPISVPAASGSSWVPAADRFH